MATTSNNNQVKLMDVCKNRKAAKATISAAIRGAYALKEEGPELKRLYSLIGEKDLLLLAGKIYIDMKIGEEYGKTKKLIRKPSIFLVDKWMVQHQDSINELVAEARKAAADKKRAIAEQKRQQAEQKRQQAEAKKTAE